MAKSVSKTVSGAAVKQRDRSRRTACGPSPKLQTPPVVGPSHQAPPKIPRHNEQLSSSVASRGPLSPLELSAPEGLEASFGCSCEGSYVAFVPGVDGTGVVYDNGAFDAPVEPGPWRAWASQPVVAEVLRKSALFGDRPPYRALLLDTARRRFWVVDEGDIQDFLRCHLAAATE